MPGIGRHLGQEPSLLAAARLALALGGPEKRWNRPKKAVPALHREAERDTTGSNSRQHPVHTWIGHCGAREASRAGNSHPYSQNTHQDAVKKPLTLQFYWARKGASEIGESVATRANRQVLLGCVLLCGAALGCAELPLVSAAEEQAPPLRPSHKARLPPELPDRLRCPARRRRQADPLCPRPRQDHPVSRLCAG